MTLPQGKHQYEIVWRRDGSIIDEPEKITADRFETKDGWLEFWSFVGGRNLPVMRINSAFVRSVKLVETYGN